MTKASILDKLLKAILEAPEDADIIFYTENEELYIAGVDITTKELRSIHSEDISLLQNQIRVYLKAK